MYAQMLAVIAVLAQTTTTTATESTPWFGAFVAQFIVGGVVGFFIGNSKGRPVAGTLLGGFLGCIGWIITAVLSKKRAY